MWEARRDVGSEVRGRKRGATCDAGNEAQCAVREMRRDTRCRRDMRCMMRCTVRDAGSEVGCGKRGTTQWPRCDAVAEM